MMELLQNYSTEAAEKAPESPAIIFAQESLSYGALESFSNQLARATRDAGCRRGDRVSLLLPKKPTAIASILGILKADCVYVPVDPQSPSERALKILESADPSLLLVDRSGLSLWEELSERSELVRNKPVLWLDNRANLPGDRHATFDLEAVSDLPDGPIQNINTNADAAYILYTSGSTGTPKGVVITHANVICFIEWAKRYFGLNASDRLSGHPPLYFDLSVFDIFGTFAAGAQLHLVPSDLNISANGLSDFIRRSELTQWFSVPSLLTYLAKFDAVRFNDFPSLKRLLWCGEVLPTPVLRHWMQRLPHVSFTNLYGPTEATIASSYFTVSELPAPEDKIPIGRACDGEELWILNEQYRPVPVGETGTLYIGGKGLSPGYWNDAKKTQDVFVANPCTGGRSDRIYNTGDLARCDQNGLIYFVGRTDSQIKSRGYRIELGEIEAALHGIEGVKEAAVVALQNGPLDNNLICCAYSSSSAAPVKPAAIRKALQKKLPSHMLPSRWIASEKLPKNMNGKVDRTVLKEWFQKDSSATLRG
jgi:amino acid adenylation domain-containing protein